MRTRAITVKTLILNETVDLVTVELWDVRFQLRSNPCRCHNNVTQLRQLEIALRNNLLSADARDVNAAKTTRVC